MSDMLAARLHKIGDPMKLERVPTPEPRPTDVVVQVTACNIVPNLKNVLAIYAEWFPYLPLPQLPAIFGLDTAGVVSKVGDQVTDVAVGDRVYINPGISCGGCRACKRGEAPELRQVHVHGLLLLRQGRPAALRRLPLRRPRRVHDRPAGEPHQAPRHGLLRAGRPVRLPRHLLLGAEEGQVGPGKTVLIDGASGTLGLGGVLNALAMGATKIFGTGRNAELLAGRQGPRPGPHRGPRRRRRRP